MAVSTVHLLICNLSQTSSSLKEKVAKSCMIQVFMLSLTPNESLCFCILSAYWWRSTQSQVHYKSRPVRRLPHPASKDPDSSQVLNTQLLCCNSNILQITQCAGQGHFFIAAQRKMSRGAVLTSLRQYIQRHHDCHCKVLQICLNLK